VTLPFVLLLIDFWPLKRWDLTRDGLARLRRRLLWEKVPFLALSLIFSSVTFFVQTKTGAVISLEQKAFPDRVVNVIHSYVGYLDKIAYPRYLCAYYFSQWQDHRWGMYLAVLIVLSAFAVWAARRMSYFTTGWFWYLGTLVPVIGLVQVGSQAMAD